MPKDWAISRKYTKMIGTRKRTDWYYICPGGERAVTEKKAVERLVAGTYGKQIINSDGRILGRLTFPPDVEQRLKDAAKQKT